VPHQDRDHRGDQPTRAPNICTGNQCRPGQPGFPGSVTARHPQPEPAGVTCHDGVVDRPARGAGDLTTASGAAASCRASTRRCPASSGDRCCFLSDPRASAPNARRMLDGWPASTRAVRRGAATGDAGPHRPGTRWPSGCRQVCRSLMDLSKEARPTMEMYAPTSTSPAPSRRVCLLAAGWPSAASASADLPPRLGPALQHRRRTCRTSAGRGQACFALIRDLKQPRPARTAGRLGRRSSAGRPTAGEADRENYGRDTTRAASRSWWRRRGEARPRPRRDRDFSYNVGREAGSHTRPERDDAALPGHRSPPADVNSGAGHAPDTARGARAVTEILA